MTSGWGDTLNKIDTRLGYASVYVVKDGEKPERQNVMLRTSARVYVDKLQAFLKEDASQITPYFTVEGTAQITKLDASSNGKVTAFVKLNDLLKDTPHFQKISGEGFNEAQTAALLDILKTRQEGRER